jgi:hypothetical protein
VALVQVFVIILGSSPSLAAAQNASSSRAAARQAVRDRLERAAAGSRELFDRTPPRSGRPFANLALTTLISEDESRVLALAALGNRIRLEHRTRASGCHRRLADPQ